MMTIKQTPKQSNPFSEGYDADSWHLCGLKARESGNEEVALKCFIRATQYINRFYPSFQELQKKSNELFSEAKSLKNQIFDSNSDTPEKKTYEKLYLRVLVRARELNPDNDEIRSELENYLSSRPRRDLTKHCFIDRKPMRARTIRYETYLRCIEFLAVSGIVGDVLEFGVLAGWSARMLAEIMRDELFFAELHLFDSFEGLPRISSFVDQDSFEIGGRNLWRDNMKFPDEFIKELGSPIEEHVQQSLEEIVSADRIQIHKGYYSETLNESLDVTPALIHIDCDLYQSTIEILEYFGEKRAFADGCVLIFDDWNCNKGNPYFGERRAFREFLKKYKAVYEVSPFFTYGHNGATFILHQREFSKQ